MLRLVFLICLLPIKLLVYSQDTLILYFDEDLNRTTDTIAKNIGVAIKEDNLWALNVYDIETKRRIIISYLSSDFSKQEGPLEQYNLAGIQIAKGYYKDGKKEALWKHWNDQGLLIDSGFFEKDIAIYNYTYSYFSDGQVNNYNAANSRTNQTIRRTYNHDGTLLYESEYIGKSGKSRSYQNGQLSIETSYDNKGKVSSVQHYAVDGHPMSKKEWDKHLNDITPEYPGGQQRLMDYFKLMSSATGEFTPVKISFYLNEKGRSYDISIEGVMDSDLRRNLTTYIEKMPSWKMKGQKKAGPYIYTIYIHGG